MSKDIPLSVDDAKLEPREDLDRVQIRALVVGGLGVALLVAGYFFLDHAAFFRAYLIGWLFCLGIAMGLFGINMLNHVSGGYWGISLRRVLEASGRTLWIFILLAAPLAFGLEEIYPWAEPGIAAKDPLIAGKAALLNPRSWIGGTFAILAIWWLFAYRISGLSRRFEETGEESYRVGMQKWSAAGLVTYVLTGTLASVLWIMSVDPHWFSSLFGFIFVAGHGLSAFAFAVPVLLFLSERQPFRDRVPAKIFTKLFHDYGKLMLAFVSLWAYFMMSQFLIIWSGNLPEEVTWYLDRASHGWLAVSIALVAGHFVLPFLFLLSQDLKKNARRLIWVSAWLLAMRWFDLFWQIAPSVSHDGVAFGLLEPVAPLAFGGLWLAYLIRQLKKDRAIMPVREPGFMEMLSHG